MKPTEKHEYNENDEATIRHAMRGPVEPVLRAQFATMRRLRALIKDAEKSNCGDGYQWKCPWCGSVLGGDQYDSQPEPHQDDCPAFTPDGTVR